MPAISIDQARDDLRLGTLETYPNQKIEVIGHGIVKTVLTDFPVDAATEETTARDNAPHYVVDVNLENFRNQEFGVYSKRAKR